MSAAAVVVLFDIDGTLMSTAGAGTRALARTFGELYGFADAMRGIRLDGRTDVSIVDEVLAARDHPDRGSAAAYERFVARYAEHLETELRTGPPGALKPGVREALLALGREPRALVGLLTGNVERGARLKLARFEIDAHFRFGAYGDDARVRPDLLPIALDRAARVAGRRFEPRHAVVIGDTPADVAVGKAHGARTIGVATGMGYRLEDLVPCEPDHLFRDFSDHRALVRAILDQ